MDVYEVWGFLVCGVLIAIAIIAVIISHEDKWSHLNNCKKTREGMARMIHSKDLGANDMIRRAA
jgi:hypothetical protein